MTHSHDTPPTPKHSGPDQGRREFLTKGASAAGLALGATVLGGAMAGGAYAQSADQQPTARRYTDKVVLITGATSGIGEGVAHAYARQGAKVFFCGRREELGRAVEQAIRDEGGDATYMRADVREESQVKAFVDACVETYGPIDIAFNNAGIAGPRGEFDEIPSQGEGSYHDIMRTHVDGVFYAMRYELPVMRSNGGGVIVNTGSMLSHTGSSAAGAYAGSKHAVIGLTRSAAAAGAGDGIRVISISPGAVETELLKAFRGGDLSDAGEDHPMGRIAQPEDIANVLLNLTAPEATYLNGDDVKIDGAQGAA